MLLKVKTTQVHIGFPREKHQYCPNTQISGRFGKDKKYDDITYGGIYNDKQN